MKKCEEFADKELDRMYGHNLYDHGARMSDPAIGRWPTMDPLCEKYYDVSPYALCGNNPVNFVDKDGRDVLIWYTNDEGKRRTFRFNGFHGKSSIKIPQNAPFIKSFIEAYKSNKKYGGQNTVKAVENHKYTIYVNECSPMGSGPEFDPNEKYSQPTVYWNCNEGTMTPNGGQSPATILEHEFDHAIDYLDNKKAHVMRQGIKGPKYGTKEEKRVIEGSEAALARKRGEAVRTSHAGEGYKTINSTTNKRRK